MAVGASELEAAAERALEGGNLDLALAKIGEAVRILFAAKDAKIAEAAAFQAELRVRAKTELAPFAELEGELPDEIIEAIAFGSLARARRAKEPEVALGILTGLRALLLERLGESHPAAVRVLAGIANTQRELGNHAGRRDTLNALIASFDCIGAMPQVVETMLQRAISEQALGEGDAELATYREALAIAGGTDLEVKCLHRLALCRARRGDVGAAEVELRDAMRAKRGQREDTARLETALAAILHQKGDREGAHALFDRAAALLPKDDPLAAEARRLLSEPA